jgi:hypothetical protein
MNLIEELNFVSEKLRNIRSNEVPTDEDLNNMMQTVKLLSKLVKTILETLPEEQRLLIKAVSSS